MCNEFKKYVDMSTNAKKAGGPDAYLEQIYDAGFRDCSKIGKIRDTWLVLTATVSVVFVGYIAHRIVEHFKNKKQKSEVAKVQCV